MRQVFLDKELEEKFQQDGFVKIPFLNQEEVRHLKEHYFETKNQSGGQFAPKNEKKRNSYDFTLIDKSSDYKSVVFDFIANIVCPPADQYLKNYRPVVANYIRKQKDDGEVPLHQNWAFVDEKKGSSVSIWCPLVDSNKENGTLQVVPRSHKRFGEVRGPMIRSELEDLKDHIIQDHMIPLDTKAGDAVILDDSLIHYSTANRTDGLRLAIQLILIPTEMDCIYFHMDLQKDPNKVEVLTVDKDFFLDFHPWKTPDTKIPRIKEFAFTPFRMDSSEFSKQLNGPRFDVKTPRLNWWQKLMGSRTAKR